MDPDCATDDAAIRAAFLELYLQDRLAGAPRSLDAYRALFPRHAELVAAELEVLTRSPREEHGAVEAERLGSYRILRELGRGSQGIVYLADDTRLGRRVALKVLSAFGGASPEVLRRFQKEAEIASRLDHPAICTVFEAGACGDRFYFAMRFVQGESLSSRLGSLRKRDGGAARENSTHEITREPRDLDALLRCFETCAEALHHAHEAGVVHRDVKPGNILITPSGSPVLLDFGVARDEGEAATLTRTGDCFGSPAYMSPELISGVGGPPDRRTDVYSLGVSLYEALTLRRPFESPTRAGLFQAIASRDAPDPRRFDPRISRDLRAVLETAMAKERDQRYQTALDFADDLARVRRREPTRVRPIGAAGRVVRWVRRSPGRAALAISFAALACALAGLGGFLLASREVLQAGELALRRTRLERSIDRGYLELLIAGSQRSESFFREALEVDENNLEAIAGMGLNCLEPCMRDAPGRAEEGLAWIDSQVGRMGRVRDLLLIRSLCLEALGRDVEARALDAEIGAERSALGCVIESSRHWAALIAFPANFRAAKEVDRWAALACDRAPRMHFFALHLRGIVALCTGELEQALLLSQAIATRWPEDVDAMIVAGGILTGPHRDRGLAMLEEATRREPNAVMAWVLLGLRLSDGEEYERGIECLERALSIGGENRWILSRLGTVQRNCEQYAAAIETFTRAIGQHGGEPEDWVGRGLTWRVCGEPARAEADFRAAVSRNASYAGAEACLGYLLRDTGRLEEAIPHLRRAFEMDGLQPGAGTQLARALELAGLDDEAQTVLEAQTRNRPADPAAWTALATFCEGAIDGGPPRAPELAAFATERAIALSASKGK